MQPFDPHSQAGSNALSSASVAGAPVLRSNERPRPKRPWILGAVTLTLVLLAIWSLGPLWFPLLLGSWFAHLMRPAYRKLEGWLGGKARSASIISVAFVLAALVPLALMGVSLTLEGVQQ